MSQCTSPQQVTSTISDHCVGVLRTGFYVSYNQFMLKKFIIDVENC